jgi:transcriptional regulator with XRE-family HTH domain
MAKPKKDSTIQLDSSSLTIAQNLKNLRTKRGFTQKDLAEKVGVTRVTIAAYEACRIRMLDTMIIKVAEALHVSTDELLGTSKLKADAQAPSRRLMKRLSAIEKLPETSKKYILKTLDALLKTESE